MLGQILPSAIQPKDINDYDYDIKLLPKWWNW